MYASLASWFHLITHPDEYQAEAEFFGDLFIATASKVVREVLELGCGGGNNASHLKKRFKMTLSDLSEPMLELSRSINPECEHIQGDMRTLRLGRQFEAVFVHDAIDYITSRADLDRVMQTAWLHCRAGGAAVFAPDFTRENFQEGTDHGGRDGERRSLRYLEWTWDPDPSDDTYLTDFAYLLREADGAARVIHDRHTLGLFRRADWLAAIAAAGFSAQARPYPLNDVALGTAEVFLGLKAG